MHFGEDFGMKKLEEEPFTCSGVVLCLGRKILASGVLKMKSD